LLGSHLALRLAGRPAAAFRSVRVGWEAVVPAVRGRLARRGPGVGTMLEVSQESCGWPRAGNLRAEPAAVRAVGCSSHLGLGEVRTSSWAFAFQF